MYDIMIGITAYTLMGICASEFIYHIYKMYKLWVQDEEWMAYTISYDPILKSSRYRDGMDFFMAAMMRILIGLAGSVAGGLMWPVTFLVIGLAGVANYNRYMLRLKKALEK